MTDFVAEFKDFGAPELKTVSMYLSWHQMKLLL